MVVERLAGAKRAACDEYARFVAAGKLEPGFESSFVVGYLESTIDRAIFELNFPLQSIEREELV